VKDFVDNLERIGVLVKELTTYRRTCMGPCPDSAGATSPSSWRSTASRRAGG